jgi:hypothetical protein
MVQDTTTRVYNAEVVKLRENQRKQIEALQLLFDLLEEYSPSWYTEEHHKQAYAALQLQR